MPQWGPLGSTGGIVPLVAKVISVPVASGHLPREVFEPAGELVALAGAEKAGLAFDDRAVGNDVELVVGAEQVVGGGEAVHEGGVAGDEAAGVDGGTAPLARKRLGLGDPARGGHEGRAPFPVVKPGVRRLPVRLEAPLEHPPAAGDDGLRVRPFAGLTRLQHPERAGGLPPAADGGPRQLAPDLFVRHHDQQQVGGRLLPAMAEEIQGAHEGREAPFHVDGAGGDQPVAVEMGLQGGEDGIEMADQQEMPARGVRSPGVEHRQGRGALFIPDLDGEPALAKGRREPLRRAAEPGGIAAVGGDDGQLAEELDGPLEEGLGEIRDRWFHVRVSLPQSRTEAWAAPAGIESRKMEPPDGSGQLEGHPMVSAVILLVVEKAKVNEVAQQLVDLQGITEVYSVAGQYDLVAIARVKDNEAIADAVTRQMLKIEGIIRSETLLAFRAFSRYDLERIFSIGAEEGAGG